MSLKILSCILIVSSSLHCCSGSAIPIWEFLSKNEKVSYLYSTFAHIVSDYCKMNTGVRTAAIAQCKRDLLAFGFEQLQHFSDRQLDDLDPYQRGASELIWSNIMQNHPYINIAKKQPLPIPSSSAITILSNGNGNYPVKNFPKNPLFESDEKHSSSINMDVAHGHHFHADKIFMNPQVVKDVSISSSSPYISYLTGPHEVRVRPDGTPVEDDKFRPIPRDEDLEAYQFAKQHKVATISTSKQRHLASIAYQGRQVRFRRQDTPIYNIYHQLRF